MEYKFIDISGKIENLERREMKKEEYEKYKLWAKEISETFLNSINLENRSSQYKDCIITDKRIEYQPEYKNVKYGNSIITNSGCAVFCINHVTRKQI